MYYTYILASKKDGVLYVGVTNNIKGEFLSTKVILRVYETL